MNQKPLLDVFVAYSNPIGWKVRLQRQQEFEYEILQNPTVKLTTIECAYGEKPFQLDGGDVKRIQVRANTILWSKENLLNIGIQRTPEAQYIAWLDGDISFRNDKWAEETINTLQHHYVIQPWSDAYDLGPKDEHIGHHKSFCRQYYNDNPVVAEGRNFWKFNNGPYDYPHPGYAWACTRQAYDWLGGLYELAVMGAGDHHMALALVGKSDRSVPGELLNTPYFKHLKVWENRALHHINHNIGFVWGTLEHFWHGRKVDRKYLDRWEMIVKYKFDPDTDLKRNSFGVLELAGNKPELSRSLKQYFEQRNEDGNTID